KWTVAGPSGAVLLGAVAKRGDTGCILGRSGRVRTRHRGAVAAVRGGSRRCIRGSVDHARKAAEAGLRDFSQHEVVGRGPGVAPGLAGRFFAGKPQRALLVVV